MRPLLESPDLEDLVHLGFLVERSEEIGVESATTWARDGSTVMLTWDAMACSVYVGWSEGDVKRVSIEREYVSKISVNRVNHDLVISVWTVSPEAAGKLLILVGEGVSIRDVQLRV